MGRPIKIFASELLAIINHVSKEQYYNIETGGDLYGLWTDDGTPVIFLATGPGPKACSSKHKFQQDYEAIMRNEEYLFLRYGLQYMGDWHSHHIIGLRQPSSGDQRRIRNLLKQPGRKRMVELIVTHNYTIHNHTEEISCFYYKAGKKMEHTYFEELDVKQSLIRRDLISRGAPINLLESISEMNKKDKNDEKKYLMNLKSDYLKNNGKRAAANSEREQYYEPLLDGVKDNILQYIK